MEWKFAPQKAGTTFVSITESGWTGSADDLLEYVANSTQGFTWTLAGLKALLEHGIQLNLVADRFPKASRNHDPQDGYLLFESVMRCARKKCSNADAVSTGASSGKKWPQSNAQLRGQISQPAKDFSAVKEAVVPSP